MRWGDIYIDHLGYETAQCVAPAKRATTTVANRIYTVIFPTYYLYGGVKKLLVIGGTWASFNCFC